MKEKISPLLSFNGGFVDTLGFLAFNGLFTAHVTGNFVTLGATLMTDSGGAITKLLALPVFCLVIAISRFIVRQAVFTLARSFTVLWWVHTGLLALGAVSAIFCWPVGSDSPAMMLSGLSLVAAMAIQNSLHKTHLLNSAPSTLMTGSTTQLMLDVVDIFHQTDNGARASLLNRMKKLANAVLFFTGGCMLAAISLLILNSLSFIIPVIVSLIIYLMRPQMIEV